MAEPREVSRGDSSEQCDTPGIIDAAIIDVGIIGGGTAGTAAVIRAIDLGLQCRVFEALSLLHGSKSADHPARRQIVAPGSSNDSEFASLSTSTRAIPLLDLMLEDMATPEGIGCLRERLAREELPVRAGSRVVGIERADRGLWCLLVQRGIESHRERILCRAILICTGASPEEQSAASTAEATAIEHSLNRPALVIGATARALDVVIAISNQKSRAGDSHGVHWLLHSLRDSDTRAEPEQPDLVAGLGDRFLAAWSENENIHLLPRTTQIELATGTRGKLLIVLNTIGHQRDRGGEDPQILEFEAECVWGIEPDDEAVSSALRIQNVWQLLSGLPVQVERRDARSQLVLDSAGRLSLPGLYAAGGARRGLPGVRGPLAGEASNQEIETMPPLESTLAEAIVSIDAIALDLSRSEAEVSAAAQDRDFDRASRLPADDPAGATRFAVNPAAEEGAIATAKRLSGDRRWRLSSLRVDGSVDAHHPIRTEVTEIGRKGNEISVPEDVHMADHHASLVSESGEFYIVDTGESASGVWLRLDSAEGFELEPEDQVWLGSQILVASRAGRKWSLVHYGTDGQRRDSYPVGEAGIFVGRGSGIALDLQDGMLSRRHAQFCLDGATLRVFDRGARNGTFVKIRGATLLEEGAEFRISTKGYRLERDHGRQPVDSNRDVALGMDEGRLSSTLTSRGGSICFEGDANSKTIPVGEAKTILQGFIESGGIQGAPLAWECQTGECGLCAIEVVAGADCLEPAEISANEVNMIARTVGLDSGAGCYRLACLVGVNGAVVLKKIVVR